MKSKKNKKKKPQYKPGQVFWNVQRKKFCIITDDYWISRYNGEYCYHVVYAGVPEEEKHRRYFESRLEHEFVIHNSNLAKVLFG